MKWLKAFRTWMRVVLPNNKLFAFVVVWWALINVVFVSLYYWMTWLGERVDPTAIVAQNAIFAGWYGWYRTYSFHPRFDLDYWGWLRMQPWTANLPLPNGPAFLCCQDLLVVTLCSLPVIAYGYSPVFVVCAYLFLATVVWTWINWHTQEDIAVYLVVFLVPLAIVFRSNPWIVLGVVALAYAVSAWGVWRGLYRFPWKPESFTPGLRKSMAEHNYEKNLLSEVPLGWPQKSLLNEEGFTGVRHAHAALISLAVVMFVSIVLSFVRSNARPVDFNSTYPLLALVVAPTLAAVRLFPYLGGTSAMDLWGRIWTGRLIIPGFHYVYLASAAILLVGTCLHYVLWIIVGLPLEWAIAIAVGINVWAMLALPPTIRNWRLTGHHRITEPSVRVGKFERL